MKSLRSFLYLPVWFVKTRMFGKKIPLQTVLFVSDQCNLRCKHCCVYAQKTITKNVSWTSRGANRPCGAMAGTT